MAPQQHHTQDRQPRPRADAGRSGVDSSSWGHRRSSFLQNLDFRLWPPEPWHNTVVALPVIMCFVLWSVSGSPRWPPRWCLVLNGAGEDCELLPSPKYRITVMLCPTWSKQCWGLDPGPPARQTELHPQTSLSASERPEAWNSVLMTSARAKLRLKGKVSGNRDTGGWGHNLNWKIQEADKEVSRSRLWLEESSWSSAWGGRLLLKWLLATSTGTYSLWFQRTLSIWHFLVFLVLWL